MTAFLTIDDPAYFDRLAEVEAEHWWSWGVWRIAAHFLDGALSGRRGLRALDVGCGTGLTAVRLAHRPEFARVLGLDPSSEALTRARRHPGLTLVRGDSQALPFADRSFDVVTCFDVFQHLPEGGDRRAAAELSRVLRPGGVAVVRSNARAGRARPPYGGTCYRLGELVDMLATVGLDVRRATYANCLPALVQEARGRVGRRTGFRSPQVRGHPAGSGLQIRMPPPAVNRLMKGVAAVEAAFAAGVGLPFGHSTMVLAERGR